MEQIRDNTKCEVAFRTATGNCLGLKGVDVLEGFGDRFAYHMGKSVYLRTEATHDKGSGTLQVLLNNIVSDEGLEAYARQE